MSKLCPKVILEGTRLTGKTELAFALNEHPRFVGPRRYRYPSPLVSAEWCGFTDFPWGRGPINYAPEEEARAFETFASTSEKAWKTFETSSQTASSGLRSLNEKIAEITRNNAEANFALAMRLAESKDVSQAMELQTEHARKQMESFVHQLEEIRDLAAQVIQDSTPPGMPGKP